jgi:hypothetical protein
MLLHAVQASALTVVFLNSMHCFAVTVHTLRLLNISMVGFKPVSRGGAW